MNQSIATGTGHAMSAPFGNTTGDTGDDKSAKHIVERYTKAIEARSQWQAHWRECYDYALPRRDGAVVAGTAGEKKTDKLFDGTAPDAVEQLAASLFSELTPPWARWFGLVLGSDMDEAESTDLSELLERVSVTLQSSLDRSNFAVEMHQCYLDLVTAGTASLLLEESLPGDASAFRFTAVPLSQVVLEEGPDGRLDTTFRRSEMSRAKVLLRFPSAKLDEHKKNSGDADVYGVIEAVIPDVNGYAYTAVLEGDNSGSRNHRIIGEGKFRNSPFINFRWLKAPGEVYGRSPVMKALPDIKTANKVVELILKNASIAVTGIWQADDDGVLNPANIKLVPGTIIPKAVGSAGLTPLDAPGRFDVSELVLDNLRASIRRALLADKLGQIDAPKMTATEVLERSAEMARLLGATYGRLQSELLTPLVSRSLTILSRRGEIDDIRIDGRMVDLEYRSPLTRQRKRQDAAGAMQWLDAIRALGPEAMAVVDQQATARWLARAFDIPVELIREPPPLLSDDLMAIGAEISEKLEEQPQQVEAVNE